MPRYSRLKSNEAAPPTDEVYLSGWLSRHPASGAGSVVAGEKDIYGFLSLHPFLPFALAGRYTARSARSFVFAWARRELARAGRQTGCEPSVHLDLDSVAGWESAGQRHAPYGDVTGEIVQRLVFERAR